MVQDLLCFSNLQLTECTICLKTLAKAMGMTVFTIGEASLQAEIHCLSYVLLIETPRQSLFIRKLAFFRGKRSACMHTMNIASRSKYLMSSS